MLIEGLPGIVEGSAFVVVDGRFTLECGTQVAAEQQARVRSSRDHGRYFEVYALRKLWEADAFGWSYVGAWYRGAKLKKQVALVGIA